MRQNIDWKKNACIESHLRPLIDYSVTKAYFKCCLNEWLNVIDDTANTVANHSSGSCSSLLSLQVNAHMLVLNLVTLGSS